MKIRSLSSLAVLCCTVLLIAGCPSLTPVENEVTWGLKAASDQLTNATANEWKAITEKVDEAVPETDITMTDEQAAAVVDFVQVNNLDSIEDIITLLENPQDVEIPDSMTQLFEDIDFETVANNILGGTLG